MDFDKDSLLKELLKNPRIQKRVEETLLTKEQMYDALNILIDMNEEKDDENTLSLTSFFVNEYKIVKRMAILSTKGKRLSYNKNVLTQGINYVNFENLEEFHKEEERKEIVNQFSKFTLGKEKEKGIYIYGDMGIGKTYILKKFAKLLAEKGFKIGFINTSNLLSEVKSTFGTDVNHHEILDMLQEVEYLFLDDIGAEKISSWFRDDFLFPLLNHRMENKKPTFFSSNYSLNQLEVEQSKTSGSKFREVDKARRLLSRIKALSNEYKLTGKNKRY